MRVQTWMAVDSLSRVEMSIWMENWTRIRCYIVHNIVRVNEGNERLSFADNVAFYFTLHVHLVSRNSLAYKSPTTLLSGMNFTKSRYQSRIPSNILCGTTIFR